MTSIGETLRRERLRRGLELDQISRELKISSRFLEAIEDEQFDRLPGGVFAKSFTRQYARYLGLDEEELAAEVQRMIEPAGPAATLEQASQPVVSDLPIARVEKWESVGGGESRFSLSSSSSLPALALVVVVMLVCSGFYSWWQSRRHAVPAPATPVETAQATPPQQPVAQPEQQPPAQQQPQAQAENPPAQPQAPAQSADTGSADRPAEPVKPAIADARNPSADNPAATKPVAAGGGPVHLELTAEEPVWVLARSDGKYLFSGTLDPNQTKTVDASGTVVLRLGNAGGVNITLNGKPIGAVGPKGQVRTIQFTSGGFQIVAAPKPSVPLEDLL